MTACQSQTVIIFGQSKTRPITDAVDGRIILGFAFQYPKNNNKAMQSLRQSLCKLHRRPAGRSCAGRRMVRMRRRCRLPPDLRASSFGSPPTKRLGSFPLRHRLPEGWDWLQLQGWIRWWLFGVSKLRRFQKFHLFHLFH